MCQSHKHMWTWYAVAFYIDVDGVKNIIDSKCNDSSICSFINSVAKSNKWNILH